jgi:hypothetical protein
VIFPACGINITNLFLKKPKNMKAKIRLPGKTNPLENLLLITVLSKGLIVNFF